MADQTGINPDTVVVRPVADLSTLSTLTGGSSAPRQIIRSGTTIHASPVNAYRPEWFGVVGDGVTDDTASLQAAFDMVPAGGVLSLDPASTYLVSSAITRTSRITLLGNGATIQESGDITTPLLQFNASGCIIRDLVGAGSEVESGWTGNSSDRDGFIRIGDADAGATRYANGAISGIRVTGFTYGVQAEQVDQLLIEDVTGTGILTSALSGNNYNDLIRVSDCDSITIRRVHGTNWGAAIVVLQTSEDVTITDVTGGDCWDNGVYVSSCLRATVERVRMNDVTGQGVKIRGEAIAASHIWIDGCNSAVNLTGNGGTTPNGEGLHISNVVARNWQVYGVNVGSQDGAYARDVHISDVDAYEDGAGGVYGVIVQLGDGDDAAIGAAYIRGVTTRLTTADETDRAGVVLSYVKGAHISDCFTEGAGSDGSEKGYGVLLIQSEKVMVTGCSGSTLENGIRITDCTQTTIVGGFWEDCAYGVWEQGSTNYTKMIDVDCGDSPIRPLGANSVVRGGVVQSLEGHKAVTSYTSGILHTASNVAPTSGTYARGSVVWNSRATSANNHILGWICVTAGTPGTWTPVLGIPDTGTSAPGTTPGFVGDQFIDTTNNKVYVATGTASSGDWTVLN